jgi:hypothetical protein
MKNIKWAHLGIAAGVIAVLPICWQVITTAVAIQQTPQTIIALHQDMTNSFSELSTQIKNVDDASIRRDNQIVNEFHKEIADNRNVAKTNFDKILKRIDGDIKIDP